GRSHPPSDGGATAVESSAIRNNSMLVLEAVARAYVTLDEAAINRLPKGGRSPHQAAGEPPDRLTASATRGPWRQPDPRRCGRRGPRTAGSSAWPAPRRGR